MSAKWINAHNVSRKYGKDATAMLQWIEEQDTPMLYQVERRWADEWKALERDGIVSDYFPGPGWDSVASVNHKALRAAGLASKEACDTWDEWEAEDKAYWAQFAK
jgi:hypothetical protein